MPLWKFRTLEEGEAHLDRRPTTPQASLDNALFLLTLTEAARRGIRTAQRGLLFYRSIEEAEEARERFAAQRLREAGPEEIEKDQGR